MEWVLSHMEDADFNDPLPAPPAVAAAQDGARSGASSAPAPDPESVAMLSSMGFTSDQVRPGHCPFWHAKGTLMECKQMMIKTTTHLVASVLFIMQPR